MAWDLELGEEDARTGIQARHGGSLSRGISAPARASGQGDILLWWRPERGEAFGYADGWTPSGDAFYFSGLGQEGDQGFGVPYQENGRLRDHLHAGDRVRLLRYVAKNSVRYVAELRLDPEDPWRWRDGPDRNGHVRKIIQFRLLPVGPVVRDPGDPLHEPPDATVSTTSLEVKRVPEPSATDVEALNSPAFRKAIAVGEALVKRRELQLVHSLCRWVQDEVGFTAQGLRIPYSPEGRNLRTDLYIPERRLLIEAKASASRENIRLAIGQLFDYRRWMSPRPEVAILVPTDPPDDMLELLTELGIGAIWPFDNGLVMRPEDLLSKGALG